MDFSIRPKSAQEIDADKREAAMQAVGLAAAAASAQLQYRAQARRALDLQMNDKGAEFGGFAA